MIGADDKRTAVPLAAPSLLRFVAIACLVPMVLIAIVAWLQIEYRHSEGIRHQAERSFGRRSGQITLLAALDDAETAHRGYLLTGDEAFVHAYDLDRGEILRQLAAAAARDPDVPREYVPAVSRLFARKLADLDASIALARGGDAAGARRVVAAGPRHRTTDALHAMIGRMIADERERSAAHTATFVAYRRWLRGVVYAVVGALILIAFVFLVVLWRMRRQRYLTVMGALDAADRHAAILDSTVDAILILEADGTIGTLNAAATELLGYEAGDLDGRNIADILDLAPEDRRLTRGEPRRSVLPDRTIRHRDGHTIAVDVAIGAMRVGDGDQLVLSIRDMAERKRIERVKDELISNVSHELRTPLTAIIGSLGLLSSGAAGTIPGEAGRLVAIAENNSHRLIRLINDMLDIDRIESGVLAMERRPLDMRDVIDQACLGSEGLALGGDVALDCDHPDAPVMVVGDADRLLQVVTNLLSNAIRVTQRGGTVDIVLRVEDGAAIIAVEDRGPGIPAAFRDRIFGRFERIGGGGDHPVTGTGLGLAISREIVVRHAGAIWFEDRAGGGTRFVLSLPLLHPVA